MPPKGQEKESEFHSDYQKRRKKLLEERNETKKLVAGLERNTPFYPIAEQFLHPKIRAVLDPKKFPPRVRKRDL